MRSPAGHRRWMPAWRRCRLGNFAFRPSRVANCCTALKRKEGTRRFAQVVEQVLSRVRCVPWDETPATCFASERHRARQFCQPASAATQSARDAACIAERPCAVAAAVPGAAICGAPPLSPTIPVRVWRGVVTVHSPQAKGSDFSSGLPGREPTIVADQAHGVPGLRAKAARIGGARRAETSTSTSAALAPCGPAKLFHSPACWGLSASWSDSFPVRFSNRDTRMSVRAGALPPAVASLV
jgi:hypothetical protein